MKLSANLQTYKKRLRAIISSNEIDADSQPDPEVRNHLNAMSNRFRGALKFINKTVSMQDLPWFVLIGPASAGKSALLAHAHAPYILQKHFSPKAPEHFDPSENIDWWATKNAGIIDVPSHYLQEYSITDSGIRQEYWKFFLSLLKKYGGKENISGIVVALPLPEIMQKNNTQYLNDTINSLSQRIRDLQTSLDKQLPCYIVITKCDLLSGFQEFFADTPNDELAQHWGIMLPHKQNNNTEKVFESYFNELIRKINQQLLSRLHQERNPIVRPYIKNFPLQIERLKSYISAFIHELNTTDNKIDIQGIYLTSALQPGLTTDTAADITNPDPEARALQIMERPTAKSRSYFIKQFITNGLQTSVLPRAASSQKKLRKKFILYAISATAISFAAIVLGRDFLTGLNQTHQIHANLADYQHVLQEFHNPDKSMLKTLTLLDTLHRTKVEDEKKTFINRILNYYSDKSQKNASKVYYSALQAFLLPEIRNYFADYLQNPINKDAESIYAVLKAYLMMGDMTHFDSNYIRSVLLGIMPKSFDKTSNLITYYDAAIKNYKPVVLDSDIIIGTRKYLLSLRGNQLGNIILRSLDNNTQRSDALLGDNDKTNALFINKKNGPLIASMYTGKNFVNVFEQEIQIAANEAAGGNWVLGTDFRINPNPNYPSELAEEMRNEYVKSYADAWETLLTNTQIETPRDLEQADAIITSMISYDSPLLRILNNIHENTFFEPVTTASPKLFSIGELIDRNNPSKTELYQILTQLEALHQYLQPVLTASDPRKAAYQLITKRMKHQGEMDPITKLRVAADQSPMPIKGWINQLTNDTWHHLLKNSMHYLDTSWAEKVSNRFETHIAHRYPFSSDASDEVTYEKFIHFFGKPGIITSYFNNYLLPFVDTSTTEWKWKSLNGQPLPLSSDSLHQIQQAINIHQAFFPKDDDNLYVPFVLQQKLLAKNIESITLNINSKIIVDKRKNGKYPHTLNWPYNLDAKFTSVALNVAGQKATQLDYPGSWGWFRLVNQSFESAKSSSQIILNFSKDDYPAKYMLSTNSKLNPFLDLNLGNFNLPKQLTTLEA